MTTHPPRISRRTLLQWLSASLMAGAASSLVGCMKRTVSYIETPEIIPRSEWNAAEPNMHAADEHGLYDPITNPGGWMVYDQPLSEVLKTVIIHHSVLPLTDGPRQIQTKHMHRGFADIGYHFVIDADGRIFEGRKITIRGAHTHGYNTGTIGVVLLGNFEESQPTAAQYASMKVLLRYLTAQYQITHVAGHRDFPPGATLCPGKNLEPLLPDLAAKSGLAFGTGGYVEPAIAQQNPQQQRPQVSAQTSHHPLGILRFTP